MNTGFQPFSDPELLDVYRVEADDHLASIHHALIELQKDPGHTKAFHDIRRRIHTLKGAAATVGMAGVANLAHRLEDLLDHVRVRGQAITPDTLSLLSFATGILQRMSHDCDEELQAQHLRDVHSRIDAALYRGSIQQPAEADNITTETGEPVPGERGIPHLLRVSRSHLANLTQMVGELSTRSSELNREQKQLIARMLSTLNAMRMLPLRMLAPRLQRIVRVTAQQENKKAVLILQGDDIHVDTTVVEQIVDPLMHLIRNAVSHGIEASPVRKALGKAEHGTIEIRWRLESNDIVIDVEDDGAGFNFPAIRAQAVSRGLLTAPEAETISQSDLCRLVLSPGFSTARSVSQVSGRGIGMDVVQEALRSLGGSIGFHSVPGKRTVVTLHVPLVSTLSKPAEPPGRPLQEPAINVMIVDDSPSMRRINASLIRKAGWTVITASDGLDALDKLQRAPQPPDAIVLDVEMPRMDGFALLSNLRNRKEYDDIPIILLTSRETEQHRRTAEELAVSIYLTKPCPGEALIGHLRRLTNEHYA